MIWIDAESALSLIKDCRQEAKERIVTSSSHSSGTVFSSFLTHRKPTLGAYERVFAR
jgi:hypothetical protein